MEKDMLSRLPEQILDIILCLLPQKEAVRTCVLSKSWRHLGSSRSKLELCLITDFNGNRVNFRSVMYNTIRRYNHHHHPLKQLSLKFSSSTFRFDLPWVAKNAPLLEELYLNGWSLRKNNLSHKRSRPVFNHLRKLSLVGCSITEEKLVGLLSSATCPLLEWLCITHVYDFRNLNIVGRLKHFEMLQGGGSPSIQLDDASKLETIRIAYCSKWCFVGNNSFPRLRSLCLKIVKLSSEAFGFFTSKYMPSLEKLELDRCYGCEEFEISSSSIKYLSIIFDRGASATKAAIIDAPNLSCFKLKAYHPLPSLSFTPTSSEWKSHVHLTTDNFLNTYDRKTICLGNDDIHRVLESLSGSQIALKLFIGKEYQRRIVDAAYHGLYKKKPLVVEHLILEFGDYSYSTFRFMFEYLFRVCRPRYIYDVHIQDMRKFLLDEREKMGYSWDRDLLEVGMESSYYHYPKDLLECDDQTICYRLKWRGS